MARLYVYRSFYAYKSGIFNYAERWNGRCWLVFIILLWAIIVEFRSSIC